MQADPTGYLLLSTKITSAYKIRRPLFLLLVNWAKDTTFTAMDGTWVDETANIKSISGSQSIGSMDEQLESIGNIMPWSMSVSLRNSAGRYSPNRTDSALTSYISGGIYTIPIKFYVGFLTAPGYSSTGTTLSGAIGSGVTTITTVNPITAGMYFTIDSEYFLALTSGTTFKVARALNKSAAASHSNGANLAILGAMTCQFTGVIQGPSESSSSFTASFNCIDRGYLLAQNKKSSATLLDTRVDTLIKSFLTYIDSTPGYMPVPNNANHQLFDIGLSLVPYGYLDDEDVYSEAAAVGASDGGRFYFNKDGLAVYENAQHWVLPNANSLLDHTVSQYTIDRANFVNLVSKPDHTKIFSNLIVEYAPRATGGLSQVYAIAEQHQVPPARASGQTLNGNINNSQTTLTLSAAGTWKSGDVALIGTEQIKFGVVAGTAVSSATRGYNGSTAASHTTGDTIYKAGTLITTLRLSNPCTTVVTPVGGAKPLGPNDPGHPTPLKPDLRDYVATTGGGKDITTDVSFSTFTVYGGRVDVTISNCNLKYNAYMLRMNLRGYPIVGFTSKQAKKTKTTIPADLPPRDKTIRPNVYIQTYQQANALADYLSDRYRVARFSYPLVGVPGIPQLECGDRVTLNDPNTTTATKDGYVLAIDWSIDNIDSEEEKFVQDITVWDSANILPVAGSTLYIIGTHQLSTGKVCWY